MCVKEEEEGVTGLVPFLTSLLERKLLLLGVHVLQQVGNTVAVAKLIVIPTGREKGNGKYTGVKFEGFVEGNALVKKD